MIENFSNTYPMLLALSFVLIICICIWIRSTRYIWLFRSKSNLLKELQHMLESQQYRKLYKILKLKKCSSEDIRKKSIYVQFSLSMCYFINESYRQSVQILKEIPKDIQIQQKFHVQVLKFKCNYFLNLQSQAKSKRDIDQFMEFMKKIEKDSIYLEVNYKQEAQSILKIVKAKNKQLSVKNYQISTQQGKNQLRILDQVKRLRQKQKKEQNQRFIDQDGYLISIPWLKRWEEFIKKSKYPGPLTEFEIIYNPLQKNKNYQPIQFVTIDQRRLIEDDCQFLIVPYQIWEYFETNFGGQKLKSKEVIRRKNLSSNIPPLRKINSSSKGSGQRGLKNIGNTCFLNSGLQCLSKTQDFMDYFEKQQYLKDINQQTINKRFVKQYANFHKQIWLNKKDAYAPRNLLKMIAQVNQRFGRGNQEDSLEVINLILDTLRDNLSQEGSRQRFKFDKYEKDDSTLCNNYASNERRGPSIIDSTFYGYFKTTLTCLQCQRLHKKGERQYNGQYRLFDKFQTISLPIMLQKWQWKCIYVTKSKTVRMVFKVLSSATIIDICEFMKESSQKVSRIQCRKSFKFTPINLRNKQSNKSICSQLNNDKLVWQVAIHDCDFQNALYQTENMNLRNLQDNDLQIIFFQQNHQGDLPNKFEQFEHQLKQNKQVTLQDCIRDFSRKEILEGQNAWWCNQCKKDQPTTKKMEIFRPNKNIIFSLKRFNESREKIKAKVNFQLKFNMRPFTLQKIHPRTQKRLQGGKMEDQIVYELYGVVNHYGSLDSGHYTAYCKNFKNGKWLSYDDSHVEQISPQEVVTSAAYILFYRAK